MEMDIIIEHRVNSESTFQLYVFEGDIQNIINVPKFGGNLIVHSAANQLRLSLYHLSAEPQTHSDVRRDCAGDEFTIVFARQ